MTARVVYLCPDDDTPSAATRAIYRHVDLLNDAGIPAAVLHPTPGFRCTWFEHSTAIVHAGEAFHPDAVVAIPETYGSELGSLFPGVRKVVFNQNARATFDGYALGAKMDAAYLHPEVEAAIVTSAADAAYLRRAFPELPVHKTVRPIESELYFPAERRRRWIAYATPHDPREATRVLALLRRSGALDGVEVLALDGLADADVAAALRETLVFLTFGETVGNAATVEHAMASGCLVAGYDRAGELAPELTRAVAPGDFVAFAGAVETLLEAHPGESVALPSTGAAAAASIRRGRSAERERDSVLACWEALLHTTAEKPAPLALVPPLVDDVEPLVSIAILTLNGSEHTRACLESIERSTAEPYELLLVDNGSTDGTVELLREYAATRANVRLVLNAENRGFAGGNNQALALARGRYVMLLNNDTLVTDGWLGRLVAAIEGTPGAGLAGPVSNYVAPPQLVEAGYTTADELDPFAQAWARAYAGQVQMTARLIGFCLLMRREVIDAIGALDESFGTGNFEDDDLCLRARSAGFECVIARDTFVHHTGSQTFIGAKIDYAASMIRNKRVFEKKWGATMETVWERGPAAVQPDRLARHLYLPLPNPATGGAGEGPGDDEATRGEGRVEEFLGRAREAVLAGDLRVVRDLFAEPAGWDEPHRAYQAVRHYAELVLATGDAITDDAWVGLYEAAVDGLLGVLEREPSEPVLLNFAGILLYELTELEGAVALFTAALRLDASLDETADNLAAAAELLDNPHRPRLERPGLGALGERGCRVAAEAGPTEGLTISLCMIVKDEEEMLPGCLAAAKAAVDEIVIVDTGSSDGTVEIAESFGAKVVSFPWNGSFADARNVSIDNATGDWIMYLDADEHLADGSAERIRSLLGRTWREAFYLIETNHTGGDESGTSVAHPAMRIFRNRPAYRFEGRIHEQKTRLMPTYLPERFETTDVRVEHFGYLKSRVVGRDKSRRNLELLEREVAEAPSPFASFNLGSEYQMLGEWERAADYFDEAWHELRRLGDWQTAGFAPMLAARTARANRECGRIDKARAVLLEAVELMPDYTDLHFELALCAQALGELDEAERRLKHCLELGDASSRYAATVGIGSHLAYGVLAEVAEARGDDAGAIALYRHGLELQPAFTGTVRALAMLLLKTGVAPADVAGQLPLETSSATLLVAGAFLEAGHTTEAEELFRRVLAQRPDSSSARFGLLETLLGQRRYAESAAMAADEPAGTPQAPLAAAVGMYAAAVLGDPALLGSAIELAARREVGAPELELYRAWAAVLAGEAPRLLRSESLEAALAALDALLRAREFDMFEHLLAVYESIEVPPRERQERLAELYLRCGYVDSAEDEWRRGPLDADSLVGLAQVALVRERPSEAAALAAEALDHDPASEPARRLVSALASTQAA